MSLTIQATPDEIIINGPGKILLSCAGYIPVADCSKAGPSHVSISLRPVLSDVSASLNFSMNRGKDLPGNVARWVFR